MSPPASTNPDPASTIWGVQLGSFARYSVSAPVLTTTRLGPGCECQPKLPPGAILFSKIHTSDSPLVLIWLCQVFETALACALISWNCPTAKTMLVTPVADVAAAATDAVGEAGGVADGEAGVVADDAAPGGAPPHVTRMSARVIEPSRRISVPPKGLSALWNDRRQTRSGKVQKMNLQPWEARRSLGECP